MKKQFLFLLTTILSFNSYSQIAFEKGYYIDNSNQKINCLIKDIDWKNNPTEFEYKLSENSESKTTTIKSIKEFGVDNISKYVRSTVNIDRSSDIMNSLSNEKNPIFNEEELFLKVLVEGKSTLYQYLDSSLKRYFYKIDNSNIEQLIFKRYKTSENYIGENNKFRQQIWKDLKCSNFKMSKIENLDYRKKVLVSFFVEYNNCNNQESVNFEEKKKRDLFNLTIRPRVNSSSLKTRNQSISVFEGTDFGNKTSFGFGLEAEFILPFNKNKWAITIEPTYQNFKGTEKRTNTSVIGGILISEVNYSSIEIPVSLRHYFFLNKNSKIFINTSYIFDSSSDSSIELRRSDNSSLESLEIKAQSNLGFGIGYKQNDKYSLEMRYQTSQDILSSYYSWDSDYKTLSIIFGYSLF